MSHVVGGELQERFPCFVAAPRLHARCRTLPDIQAAFLSLLSCFGGLWWLRAAPMSPVRSVPFCAAQELGIQWGAPLYPLLLLLLCAAVRDVPWNFWNVTSFSRDVRQAQCALSLTNSSFSVRQRCGGVRACQCLCSLTCAICRLRRAAKHGEQSVPIVPQQ